MHQENPKDATGATVFSAEAAPTCGRIARCVPSFLASLALGLVDRVSEM